MAHATLLFWMLAARLGPCACSQGTPRQDSHPPPDARTVSSVFVGNSLTAFRLYGQIAATHPDRNIIFSPLSITVPLTLLALQAKPATRSQVLESLGLARVPSHSGHKYYSQLLGALLRAPRECKPSMGSVLFVDQKKRAAPKFVDVAQSLYSTEVFPVPFGDRQVARSQMDRFMREKTSGRIKKLALEVNSHAVLVLANYLFFKGKWKTRFEPLLTTNQPFSVREGLTVQVPTMGREAWVQHQRLPLLHSHILRLAYGCDAKAVFILPDAGKVREAEKALLRESFHAMTQNFPPSMVRLYMPKFSLSGNYQLHQLLPALGIDRIFSQQASIRGVSLQTAPAQLSRAEHWAELTVDEEGEGEAGSKDFLPLSGSRLPSIHFNRPFLFIIYQKTNRSILFIGKVVNPIAKA